MKLILMLVAWHPVYRSPENYTYLRYLSLLAQRRDLIHSSSIVPSATHITVIQRSIWSVSLEYSSKIGPHLYVYLHISKTIESAGPSDSSLVTISPRHLVYRRSPIESSSSDRHHGFIIVADLLFSIFISFLGEG